MLIPYVNRQNYWFIAAAGALLSLSFVIAAAIYSSSGNSPFPPGSICWSTSPSLVYVHLIGDTLIWSAYTMIPVVLIYLLVAGQMQRTSRVTFPTLIIWGALFIWFCGETHLMDAIELWWSVQWARGVLKLATGVISWVFVALLFRHRLNLLIVARAINRAAKEEGL